MPALDVTIGGVMLASFMFYAILGGADFGAGVWDLLAYGARARRQREALSEAVGPIWEANHVWLILIIVMLFTGFPMAFSVIMTALHIPLTLMLIGIVLRGTSFTFRHYDSSADNVQQRWGRIFAISSLATPFFIGVIIGTISSGNITVEDGTITSGWFAPWLQPFPLAVGGFTIALFTYIAAVYMTVEVMDDPELEDDFRLRALGAAIIVGGFALMVFILSTNGATTLRADLAGSAWTWPLQVTTGAVAVGTLVMLWKRFYTLARALAVAQVILILLGWGLALNPYLVIGDVSLHDAAAPNITLKLLLGGLTFGALVLFPALYYLYRVFKGEQAFAVMDRSA